MTSVKIYIGKSSKLWKIGQTAGSIAQRQANIRQYYKQDRDFTIVSYVEFIAPKCIADLAESYARCVQVDGYELYGKDHFKKQGKYKDFENKALNYITEFLNSKNIDYRVVRK